MVWQVAFQLSYFINDFKIVSDYFSTIHILREYINDFTMRPSHLKIYLHLFEEDNFIKTV